LKNIPVDITVSSYSTLKSSEWKNAVNTIEDIEGIVRVEVISRANLRKTTNGNYTAITVAAISNTSKVYDGLSVVDGGASLGINETYVWKGSKAASEVSLGDIITLNFTYTRGPEEKTIAVLSLKVVGFVEFNTLAYSIATGEWGTPVMILQEAPNPPFYGDLLLITSWEKTFAKLLDSILQDLLYYTPNIQRRFSFT
jgi:hypothetical protein